jgi:hypothetical protein
MCELSVIFWTCILGGVYKKLPKLSFNILTHMLGVSIRIRPTSWKASWWQENIEYNTPSRKIGNFLNTFQPYDLEIDYNYGNLVVMFLKTWQDHLLGFGFKIPFVNMFLALFLKPYGIINWGLFKCRSPQWFGNSCSAKSNCSLLHWLAPMLGYLE